VKPINMTREWQIQAKGWAAIAEERREKIERALQLLREAVTKSNDAAGFSEGLSEGWEMVDQAVHILEGQT
jgi:hypothetical protein